MSILISSTNPVREHHLFSSLPDAVFWRLMARSKSHRLEKDDLLFRQDSEANHFYFVLFGTIKLCRVLSDGSEKIIELVPPGVTFGEALILKRGTKYPVTAQAVESSEVIGFSNNQYLSLLQEQPELAIALLSGMSHRLHMRINEIEVLSIKNATHRVVRYLITLAVTSCDIHSSFNLPAEKRLIAGQLGIRPETFSRVVSRLKDEGIIDIKGRRIIVLDQNALLNYE